MRQGRLLMTIGQDPFPSYLEVCAQYVCGSAHYMSARSSVQTGEGRKRRNSSVPESVWLVFHTGQWIKTAALYCSRLWSNSIGHHFATSSLSGKLGKCQKFKIAHSGEPPFIRGLHIQGGFRDGSKAKKHEVIAQVGTQHNTINISQYIEQ